MELGEMGVEKAQGQGETQKPCSLVWDSGEGGELGAQLQAALEPRSKGMRNRDVCSGLCTACHLHAAASPASLGNSLTLKLGLPTFAGGYAEAPMSQRMAFQRLSIKYGVWVSVSREDGDDNFHLQPAVRDKKHQQNTC